MWYDDGWSRERELEFRARSFRFFSSARNASLQRGQLTSLVDLPPLPLKERDLVKLLISRFPEDFEQHSTRVSPRTFDDFTFLLLLRLSARSDHLSWKSFLNPRTHTSPRQLARFSQM